MKAGEAKYCYTRGETPIELERGQQGHAFWIDNDAFVNMKKASLRDVNNPIAVRKASALVQRAASASAGASASASVTPSTRKRKEASASDSAKPFD